MTAPPLPAATVEAAADDGTDPRGLRRTLAALLLITMFAGFQQSYFTPSSTPSATATTSA